MHELFTKIYKALKYLKKKIILQLAEELRSFYTQPSQMRHQPEAAEKIENNSFATKKTQKNIMKMNLTTPLLPFAEHAVLTFSNLLWLN